MGKKERVCAECGKIISTMNPGEYQYKARDWRKDSEAPGRLLWFCTDGCQREFERKNNRRRNNKWNKL